MWLWRSSEMSSHSASCRRLVKVTSSETVAFSWARVAGGWWEPQHSCLLKWDYLLREQGLGKTHLFEKDLGHLQAFCEHLQQFLSPFLGDLTPCLYLGSKQQLVCSTLSTVHFTDVTFLLFHPETDENEDEKLNEVMQEAWKYNRECKLLRDTLQTFSWNGEPWGGRKEEIQVGGGRAPFAWIPLPNQVIPPEA